MKCLALRHVAFEDLGLFAPVLARRGYHIDYRQAGNAPIEPDEWQSADLVVVLGGPVGIADGADFPWLADEIAAVRQRLNAQRPLLGLCLGAQIMACALGARVYAGPAKEIGWAPVSLSEAGAHSAMRHLADHSMLHWHGDTFDLPNGATRLASTTVTPNQAFSAGRSALALQFHPEVQPSTIESWLIGHLAELRHAAVDIGELRATTARLSPSRDTAATAFLDEWLDGVLAAD